MNRVIIIGRITKDPEVRYAQSGTCIARYTLAVDRSYKNAEGNYEADFISCQAFGKNGEFAEKYLKKGMKIAIEGEIRTGSYTNKDGQKVYTTDVVVNHHEFTESKKSEDAPKESAPANEWMNIPDGLEELPFN